MTPLKQNIMRVLRSANALTAGEIAMDITAHRDVVQAALHELDDSGHVLMRHGFYRVSEFARRDPDNLDPYGPNNPPVKEE